MNILWICPFVPFPPNHGGKLLAANRIGELSKKHTIYLIAEGIPEESDIDKIKCVCKDYVIVPPPKRNAFRSFFWFAFKSRNVGNHRNKNITYAINAFLDKHHIDLIVVEHIMSIINLLPLNKKTAAIPIVVSQQNIEFDTVKSRLNADGVGFINKFYSFFEWKKLFRWENNIYKKSRLHIVSEIFVTNEDKDMFITSFKTGKSINLFVSPIGTYKKKIKESANLQSCISSSNIVFVGSFDYGPNIHGGLWFANNVMPIIRKTCPDAVLYLVGRNPDSKIKALSSRKDIVVTGTVDCVDEYLNKATMFVVPLFFGGGMKTKLVEMGMYGKPTITTQNGLKGTIFEDKQDVVVCNTADEFAFYSIDILNNKQKYLIMAENYYKKTIENYLWDNICIKLEAFLKKMVDENENRINKL